MSHHSRIAIFALIMSFPARATAVTPNRPEEAQPRVAPAVHAEPERASDSRLATLRSESANRLLVAELADARVVAADEIVALKDELRAGHTPTRNGFLRELPPGLDVTLEPPGNDGTDVPAVTSVGLSSTHQTGRVSWAGQFRAVGAWALRLHLSRVAVPEGTTFVVCGTAQADCTAFGTGGITESGEIWTPIVEGERLHLEIDVPAHASRQGPIRFVPSGLLELVSPDVLAHEPLQSGGSVSALDTSCLVPGECAGESDFAVIGNLRAAYAHLQFVKDGSNYICSGALVNDDGVEGFIPYLLTANHCFATQASATSLVAYFDYRYSSCSGGRPALSSLPRVSGATLLSTSANSDFTFLRLSSAPSGYRWYLGWDARGIPSGASLYRLSHPSGLPQHFSVSQYVSSPSSYCSSLPPNRYVYSSLNRGSTAGGSSGAPVLLPGGYIVGQLYGRCGTGDLSDPCDPRNSEVDGSFGSTYPLISHWLRPASGPSKPVPDFGFSPTNPRVGEPVQFTDITSNGPTTWSWTFGDGALSTQKNPSHTYSMAGTYTVSLTAANAAGSASTSRTITVSALPLPPVITYFGVNPPAIAPGQTVTLTWTSTGGTAAFINQGVGQVPTTGNRTIVPVTGVPYTLTVSGPTGTSQASLTIGAVGTTYANTWVVPSTARVDGTGGAFWTTELTVMNAEPTTISVNLKFLGHGESGLQGPERTFSLAPFASRVIPDVLGSEFGLATDWGPILIRTVTGSVVTQSQTSTPGGGGTYGQSVPAVSRAQAIGTTPRAIAGIRQDSTYRTNIVLVNLAEQSALIDIALLSPTGVQLASTQETLGPLGFRQLNVASNLGVSNVVGGTLLLSSRSSLTPVAAYASVIDNRTADPRTLLPQ